MLVANLSRRMGLWSLLLLCSLLVNCGQRPTSPVPATVQSRLAEEEGESIEKRGSLKEGSSAGGVFEDGADGGEDKAPEAENDADQAGGGAGGSGDANAELDEEEGNVPAPKPTPPPKLSDSGCVKVIQRWRLGDAELKERLGKDHFDCTSSAENYCQVVGEDWNSRVPDSRFGGRFGLLLNLTPDTDEIEVRIKKLIREDEQEKTCTTTGNSTVCGHNFEVVDTGEFMSQKLKKSAMETAGEGNYFVDFHQIVAENNWREPVIPAMTIRAYSYERELDKTCDHTIHIESPLVMDFSGKVTYPDSISPALSGVIFDLDGDGAKEAIGWTSPQLAFLALDHNQNGTIDDGTELFGERTLGLRFDHGYQALAQFDSNHDGQITSADSIFEKLLVWHDLNSDGISQIMELQSLALTGVDAIATTPQLVERYQKRANGNFVPYQSKFTGLAHCPVGGCVTFDIFFGMSSQFSMDSEPTWAMDQSFRTTPLKK